VDLRAEVLYIVSFEEGPFCEPGMGMKFVDIAPRTAPCSGSFIHEKLGAGIIPSGPAAGQA